MGHKIAIRSAGHSVTVGPGFYGRQFCHICSGIGFRRLDERQHGVESVAKLSRQLHMVQRIRSFLSNCDWRFVRHKYERRFTGSNYWHSEWNFGGIQYIVRPFNVCVGPGSMFSLSQNIFVFGVHSVPRSDVQPSKFGQWFYDNRQGVCCRVSSIGRYLCLKYVIVSGRNVWNTKSVTKYRLGERHSWYRRVGKRGKDLSRWFCDRRNAQFKINF